MLRISTQVYATHTLPLECDIYTPEDVSEDAPVVLFFHAGALVGWNRHCIPPWLVQVCYNHGWLLMSASYRMLPQSSGQGLKEDAEAAYKFAQSWRRADSTPRRVVLCGASAGFFLVALILHHCQPAPLAVLSISGINTFRHPFYNSSTSVTSALISDDEVSRIMHGPTVTGTEKYGFSGIFHLDKLTANGYKNRSYEPPIVSQDSTEDTRRGLLYGYYIQNNSYLDMVGDHDPGYDWAKDPEYSAKVKAWPPTIAIHGNADQALPLDMSVQMRISLGEDKVHLFIAEGQDHLFELDRFVEDPEPEMNTIRDAVACLIDILGIKNDETVFLPEAKRN